MNNKLITLLIFGLFASAYFVGQWLQSHNGQKNMAQKDMRYEPCSPALNDCVAFIGQHKLVISFSGPPSALQPFQVRLLGENITPDSVSVEFAMRGMDMGMNRYALKPVSKATWSREVILPVCSLGRHDWESRFEVDYQGVRWLAIFNFEQVSK